ncbi:MAG: hypothetical protein JW934_22875 [Anaerolineae bacterium]|nr:hypothetical protein [Anaerolineae bacterium]
MTLHVDDVTNLYGYQANLQFDPALLQVVDADAVMPDVQVEVLNTFLQPDMLMTNVVNNAAGTIMCTVMQMAPTPSANGSGDLLAITFEGLAEGLSDISFVDLNLFDDLGAPIATTLVPAQIEVGASMPTPTPTVPGPTPTVTPTPTLAPSTMGNLLKGIACDPLRGLVYVAVQSDDTVAIVDELGSLIDKVSAGGLAPSGLALNSDGSRLFVVNSGSNQVAVLDANAGYAVETAIDVGQKPFGIAIGGNVAYVTNFDDGTVTLFDVNTLGVIETFWVGHHPTIPAATDNRAFVPVHSAFSRFSAKDPQAELEYVRRNKGTDTGVVILYGDGRADPVSRVLENYVGFFAAAIDEVNGRVYVTKRDGTAEGLYVLDLADHSLIQFVPMLRPYAVAVNPVTQHVFVVQADMDEVYVLDATQGYRMIGAFNTDPNNGDIPGMHGGQGVAMSSIDAVVSNYEAGTLTFINDGQPGIWPVPIDVEYIRGWQEGGGNHGPLGVPTEPSASYWYSEQQYERGSTHWRLFTGGRKIVVFDNQSLMTGGTDWMGRDSGVWAVYDDLWTPGMSLFPAACLEAWWPYGPMFGFGVAWCSNPDTVKARIGYPIGWEYGTVGGHQTFVNGMVWWNPASDAYYVLRNDNLAWRYFRAHRRYEAEIEPNVVGQVQLQGRTDHRGIQLTSISGPHTATNEQGQFGLHLLGQVDLNLHYSGYLDMVVTVKGDGNALFDAGAIQMVGGDVNGDNRIDILDLSFIGYNFGSQTLGADVNGDGRVDILDLSLVGANFGRAGPIRWAR